MTIGCGEMSPGEKSTKRGIPTRGLGEKNDPCTEAYINFRTDDGVQLHGSRRLGELHRSVDSVAVGEGKSPVPK